MDNQESFDGETPRTAIVVFAKFPIPGRCKTRLIGALTPDEAADVQRDMTRHVLQVGRDATTALPVELVVFISGASEQEFQNLFGTGFVLRSQCDGDLGCRLRNAANWLKSDGFQRALVIGTDCPTLDVTTFKAALNRLRSHDVCLAPAFDGGYVLIGFDTLQPGIGDCLFREIEWGTERVLHQSIGRVLDHGFRLSLLAAHSDVDHPEDLPVWECAKKRAEDAGAKSDQVGRPENHWDEQNKVSVVIPVLNEEALLDAAISSTATSSSAVEVVVVAAGDAFQTFLTAAARRVSVVSSPPGRARQLNLGASMTCGAMLCFLHADSRLPKDFDTIILKALGQSQVVVGAFRLSIESPRWAARCIEWLVAWRGRWLSLPYGDQALFLRRSDFDRLGMFPDMPIMEDYVLVQSAKRLGRITVCPQSVTTSARRWEKLGYLKTTLLNQIVILGYCIGVAPERLSRLYRRTKTPKE